MQIHEITGSNLEEALKKAFGERYDKGSEGSGLSAFQTETRLREIFHQFYGTEPEEFEPGDIVGFKMPSVMHVKGEHDPFLFVRYLDKPLVAVDHSSSIEELTGSGATCIYDCVIGVYRSGAYFEHFVSSAHLKKFN